MRPGGLVCFTDGCAFLMYFSRVAAEPLDSIEYRNLRLALRNLARAPRCVRVHLRIRRSCALPQYFFIE